MAKIEHIRHSLAHLLASAVLKKYPGVKLGIGPTIENGFYYDFLFQKNHGIKEDDLIELEKEMISMIKENLIFSGEKITPAKARKMFASEPFKLELINELVKAKDPLSVYNTHPQNTKYKIQNTKNFIDLCRGGHVKTTKEINPEAFKLTKIAGAYWKGSEKNQMLTRIYGIAFENKEELGKYLKLLEEAEKRDHKKLGSQLDLFMFHETAPGMPYWLPKGVIILNELIAFWREEHAKRSYQEIKSPLINKKELFEISGHWKHYKENMFIAETSENETYCLKPMNCPNAMVVFGSKKRSYRELPLRLSDTDTLHRFERSGTLNGLLRVREFSQDDAHIFITEDQIKSECLKILEITERFYSIFNIEYSLRLGTRPEKYMGDEKSWVKAEKTLKEILKASEKPFYVLKGDGAFYGPKIDIIMKDALGREWQMGTIQLDFQIPRKFNLTYIDKDSMEKTPVVIHRVIYGSLERFMGILIEHLVGAFPLWVSPTQVEILPISENYQKYASEIEEKLKKEKIRVRLNNTNETLGKRIREAEMQKIPYIVIIGEKEIESKTIAIRERGKGDIGQKTLDSFIEILKIKIGERTL